MAELIELIEFKHNNFDNIWGNNSNGKYVAENINHAISNCYYRNQPITPENLEYLKNEIIFLLCFRPDHPDGSFCTESIEFTWTNDEHLSNFEVFKNDPTMALFWVGLIKVPNEKNLAVAIIARNNSYEFDDIVEVTSELLFDKQNFA
jgi:hypothetical protein